MTKSKRGRTNRSRKTGKVLVRVKKQDNLSSFNTGSLLFFGTIVLILLMGLTETFRG